MDSKACIKGSAPAVLGGNTALLEANSRQVAFLLASNAAIT